MFQATGRVFIRHRRFLYLLRRILSLTFGSLWLVFPATRILHENLEPGRPSSSFLSPVLKFRSPPPPPQKKRVLPLKKKKIEKKRMPDCRCSLCPSCYQLPSWLRTLSFAADMDTEELGTTPHQQLTWLGVLESKTYVEHVLHVARIQSCKPRPNSCELSIAGSVITSRFSIKGKLKIEKI